MRRAITRYVLVLDSCLLQWDAVAIRWISVLREGGLISDTTYVSRAIGAFFVRCGATIGNM